MRYAHQIVALIAVSGTLLAQGYDDTFEMKNKVKLEYQYSDYFRYEYPEPVLFYYGVSDYRQDQPYIANFPEHRSLVKFTRTIAGANAFSGKYQYSLLRKGVVSNLFDGKFTATLSKDLIMVAGCQLIDDSRDFSAWQPGVGIRLQMGPLTILQADIQYYMRGKEAVALGGALNSLNLQMKLRQVLTMSTAVMLEYVYYDADGDSLTFTSSTWSLWLSQFLPTQTALHLNLRYYGNSAGIWSLAPSLEIAQYLTWATVLRLKYRYYTNSSDNVSLGESDIIIPDNLRSNAVSLQCNHEFGSGLEIYGKYRYYLSNKDVEMNTLLAGVVYTF
ncbi:hypothetical protein JXO52_06045 [bacterium]|nr:hypothetical protein [bacterium]